MIVKKAGITLGLRLMLFPMLVVIAIVLGLELGIHLKSMSDIVATYGIPAGLFFMIYPPMTKVSMQDIGKSLTNIRAAGLMLVLNYLIDPFLVAGLGYFFFDLLFYRMGLISLTVANQAIIGVILLGVAPCIAMVIVWTSLSKGNLALAVSFVVWNSIIQVITTPFLVYLLARTIVVIDPSLILKSALLYLALPLLAGIVTRRLLIEKDYFPKVVNALGYVQTIALLFTIVAIFWSEGYGILEYPDLIWMTSVIILSFYFILFHIGYFASKKMGFNYEDSTAIGYSVAARDFEVSIAIAIVAFAEYPFVRIVTALGPLLEIPLMLVLVWVQLTRFKNVERIQKSLKPLQ